MWSTILHSAAAHGAVSGLVAAAGTDLHVLLSGQDWSVLKTFKWNVATYRWCVGIISGALAGAGYGALLG